MALLLFASVQLLYVSELAWERDAESCLWRWQVAPWLTHCEASWTDPHILLVFFIHFPRPFSFRKRPNKPQQVNVKKREGTPLWSAFQACTMSLPTSCTTVLKPWLKLFLLAADWGCKAKTNKNCHCWGLIMNGPNLQSAGLERLAWFCFLSGCVSLWASGRVSEWEKEERLSNHGRRSSARLL